MYRKIISSLIVILVAFTFYCTDVLAAPQIVGKSGLLMDLKSGQILYSKDVNKPLPPASTTKILTAIIALENCEMSDVVTSGKNPTLVEPSAIGLREGESITMENLLYSLLLKSANDAAVAIAEHISGSVEEFAKLMNKKAKELGVTNSNFVTPNGLPHPEHYSSAEDLALIARYAMSIPEFREIVATKVKIIPRANDSDIKYLENHNKLLWRYEGTTGVKTGYTMEARQCLVASAARSGQEFIAVVLGSEGINIWSDAQSLLDYGFNNFDTVKFRDADSDVRKIAVKNGNGDVILRAEKDFYYTVPKGEKATVIEKVEINGDVAAPIRKGQVVGRLKFLANGGNLGTVNLVAANDVKAENVPVPAKGSAVNRFLAGTLLIGVYIAWNIKKKRRKVRSKKRFIYNKNGYR